MAVGNQTSQNAVNQDLTTSSVTLRDAANLILIKQAYYVKLGLTGLEGLGYDAADAQAVLDNFDHMATVAQVYKGTATQAALFNFEDYLTPLWAGQ